MKAESGQRVAANSQFIKTVDNVWCAEDCLVRSWIYSYCSYPYVVGIERGKRTCRVFNLTFSFKSICRFARFSPCGPLVEGVR